MNRMAERAELSLSDVADVLRRILETVERGELTAPGPMISHLQGALAAVEALGGLGVSPTANPRTV